MGEKSTPDGFDMTKGRSGKSPSFMPPTSSIATSTGINHGFLHFQPPPYAHSPAPYAHSPPYVHNFDGNFFPMHQQSMSFMNMLNSPPAFTHQPHGSTGTGVVPSPTSDRRNTSEPGCHKRAANEEAVESSSPPKTKRKKQAAKRKTLPNCHSGVASTRWWTAAHDVVLIPFLVKMAKEGHKLDKTFKKDAFRHAAIEVNKHFGTTFTDDSVANHMRTLTRWFNDMQTVRNISGAGWDEKTKTITMDPECFDRWNEAKNKSRLKEYINKPLKYYDELSIIIGDDHARGDHAKAAAEKFGGRKPIILDGDDEEDGAADDDSPTFQESPQVQNLDEDYTPPQNTSKGKAPVQPNSHRSTTPKVKGKKQNFEHEIMQQMVDEVKQFSASMKSVNMHWTEKLSKAVFAHTENYPIEVLELFYDSIFENEVRARHFIGKSQFGQRSLLDKFMKEQQDSM